MLIYVPRKRPSAPPDPSFAIAGATRARDPASLPATLRQITFETDINLAATGATQRIFDIEATHVMLEVLSTGGVRVSLKTSDNAVIFALTAISGLTWTFGVRHVVRLAVDLDAGRLWVVYDGTVYELTYTAPAAGIYICGASREIAFFATASTTGATYATATVYSLTAWETALASGARPTTNLRSGLPITGPAATFNASGWRDGPDAT